MAGPTRFLASPLDWQRAADQLVLAGDRGDPTGLDTEFDGYDWATGARFDYDPSAISPISRTRVVIWSVAVLLPQRTARGYRKAHPAVLPEVALDFPPLRAWLESDSLKCVHNLPADAHTLANHGIWLGGGRDTLALARWCWPARAELPRSRKPFALKTLAADVLGYTVDGDFDQFMEPNLVERPVVKTVCACGVDGCRKKKAGGGVTHEKSKVEETEVVERGKKPMDLRTIVPGHPLWDRWVNYAGLDAVWALELNEAAKSAGKVDHTW